MSAWGYEFDDSDQGLDIVDVMLRGRIISSLWDVYENTSLSFMEHRAMVVTAKRMLEATSLGMDKERAIIFEKICQRLESDMEEDASNWQEPEEYIKELTRDLKEVREWIAESLQD